MHLPQSSSCVFTQVSPVVQVPPEMAEVTWKTCPAMVLKRNISSFRAREASCCPLWGQFVGLVPGPAWLPHSWLPSPPPLENKQKFCSCQPPGKESTGILKRQLMFATTDVAEPCSFQSHSLPLAPSPPAAFCGFSFISCFSFSLELSVRAEVQIKLQLRCALLGIMELALCVAAR